MYLMMKKIILALTILFLLVACNDKENSINITDSNLIPLAGEIDTFTDNYSFRDEISVNGENYKLLVSNTPEVEAQTILSFAYFPENAIINSDASLTLYSNLKPYGEMEFNLNLLEQDYLEASADWEEAEEGVIWDQSLIIPSATEALVYADTIATSIDSLVFTIPQAEIEDFLTKDLDLFSLIISSPSDNYIEFYSSEHEKSAKLFFTYELLSDGEHIEDREYDRKPFKDTYIINDKQAEQDVWDNTIEYSNMPPKQAYLKFDFNPETLFNQDGQALTPFQLRHLTVNDAYLRLYIKDYSFFVGSRLIYLTPYRVKSEITETQALDSDMIEYLVNTGTSSKNILSEPDSTQYIDIKITPILQGFISGEKENFGIVLKSPYQSSGFDAVQFYNIEEDPALKPKIHFIYTLPMEEN